MTRDSLCLVQINVYTHGSNVKLSYRRLYTSENNVKYN